MSKIHQRALELRRLLEHHNRLYYVEAKPEISDREFDRHVKRSQQTTHRTYQPLDPLHAPFVLFHTLFELRQTPRLSDA